MSYEGYNQMICTRGHRFDRPESYGQDPYVCDCGAEPAWCNAVDDTNCDAYGVITDFSSLLIEAEETKTCDLGHVHVTREARYRVPTEDEANALRHRWDYHERKYYPLEKKR